MGRPDAVLSIHAFLRLLLHLWRRTRFLTRPHLAHHFGLWLVSSGWRSAYFVFQVFNGLYFFIWQSACGLPAMVVKKKILWNFYRCTCFFPCFWKHVVNTQVQWCHRFTNGKQTWQSTASLTSSSSLKTTTTTTKTENMENIWKRLQSVKDESSQRLSCQQPTHCYSETRSNVRGQHSCTQTVKRWIYDKNHFLFGFNY